MNKRRKKRKSFAPTKNIAEFVAMSKIVKHLNFEQVEDFYNVLNLNRKDNNNEWLKLASFIALCVHTKLTGAILQKVFKRK